MTNIIQKIREFLIAQLGDVKLTPSMRVSIGCIVLLVVFTFFVYIAGWFFLFTNTGQVTMRMQLLTEWRSFIALLFSGGFTTAVLFYLKLSVDKNQNGVPDALEEEDRRPPFCPPK